jgi:hypothetical protein
MCPLLGHKWLFILMALAIASAQTTPIPIVLLLLLAYPLLSRHVYQLLPRNAHLFWLHYSGLSAGMLQYVTSLA